MAVDTALKKWGHPRREQGGCGGRNLQCDFTRALSFC